MRRVQPDTVEEVQPGTGKIGEVARRQALLQRLRGDVAGQRFTAIAQHPVDFIAPGRHGVINGFLNPALPRLAGEHPRHRLRRAEQATGVGLRRHVLQRHVRVAAAHPGEHVLIQRTFRVAPANLLQQHLTYPGDQLPVRRDFPGRLRRQALHVKGVKVRGDTLPQRRGESRTGWRGGCHHLRVQGSVGFVRARHHQVCFQLVVARFS